MLKEPAVEELRYYPGTALRHWGESQQSSISVVGILAEIWTQNIPAIFQSIITWANLLGIKMAIQTYAWLGL
jgi:hypothetical protein